MKWLMDFLGELGEAILNPPCNKDYFLARAEEREEAKR
jgi:hypothetical protein